MTTFRVGQRARFVRPIIRFDRLGQEGTVVDRDFVPKGTMLRDGPAGEDFTLTFRFDDGWLIAARDEYLEPIQPERNQVIAWSECLWQPPKELVT